MLEKLEEFYGIGPVQAKELLERLQELQLLEPGKEYREKELRTLLKKKEVFNTLPAATKADLLYTPLKEIPREIIHVMAGEMEKYLRGIKFEIGGSYSRGKPMSHDIDIAVCKGRAGAEVADRIIKQVNSKSKMLWIFPPFARGEDKVVTLFEVLVPLELRSHPLLKHHMTANKKVRIKVDLFLAEPEDYIPTLLFVRGSGRFNVRMRMLAKRKGLLLNQKGVFRRISENLFEKIPTRTEKEIFEVLGMRYRPPEERNV